MGHFESAEDRLARIQKEQKSLNEATISGNNERKQMLVEFYERMQEFGQRPTVGVRFAGYEVTASSDDWSGYSRVYYITKDGRVLSDRGKETTPDWSDLERGLHRRLDDVARKKLGM